MWRIRNIVACLALAAIAFNSDAGRVAGDTKLDLAVNPWGFLGRALHAWDRTGSGGQMQNQAYGYLFPMGPFFGIGHSLGLPAWVIQRLWWATLLSVAFLGIVVLADRMQIGSPITRMLGGFAYALSPHLLTVLGPVSSEALPMCLTPWALVPLVSAVRGGSPRRAAMRSGVAILLMGAVNAAVVVAAVVPVVLWLVTRPFDRRHVRLCLWWLLAVAAACTWWVVPLLVLGRYSPPFLDYIENSGITTSVSTLIESLRGTADWQAYLPTAGWRAGWTLLTQPAVVLNSVIVLVLGVVGLGSRSLRHRRYLILCLLVGLVLLCAGYVGTVDGSAAQATRSLLDGVLAPLRNVHKFDVVVRLPLVLGMVGLLSEVRWGRLHVERQFAARAAPVIGAVVIVGAAAPFVALHTASAGTYTNVPEYWAQAAGWLGANARDSRALVVPGARTGYYVWGHPMDEPLQPLARSPWEVRDAIPFVPVGHIRVLDAVEQRLVDGSPSPGLAAFLSSSGFGYLVVRNDLDYAATGAPAPELVHAALASPGLDRVASFGPLVGSVGTADFSIDRGMQGSYPAVEIFRVAPAGGDARAQLVPQTDVIQVSGAPESALDLADVGLRPGPAVLSSDPPAGLRPGAVVVTDGSRRQERTFGRNDDAASQTLAATDPLRFDKRRLNYVDDASGRSEPYVRYTGIASVTASSSGSDATARATVPGQQPFAAVDADPATAWMTAPLVPVLGQWLQVDFTRSRDASGTRLLLAAGSRVNAVTTTTRSGSLVTNVYGDRSVLLAVPPGKTDFLRVTFSGLQRAAGPPPVQEGIADLVVPGLQARRTIVVPDDLGPGTPVAAFLFSARDDARDGCIQTARDSGPLCALGLARDSEDESGIDRAFTVTAPATYAAQVAVRPRAGPELDALLRRAISPRVVAGASSQAVPDPSAGPASAVDASPATTWVADPTDPTPTLSLSWKGRAVVSSLRIVAPPPAVAATRPKAVIVTVGGDSYTRVLGSDGVVKFPPTLADRLRIQFVSVPLRVSLSTDQTFPVPLGIGVSEIDIPGVSPSPVTESDTRVVRLPCGAGPDVVVDGRRVPTSLVSTVREMRLLRPVPLTLCTTGRGDLLSLLAGQHALTVASTDTLRPVRVMLTSVRSAALAPDEASGPESDVAVRRWSATSARVALPERPDASVLVLDQNVNPGWHARLSGHALEPVTIAGWQQGYVVPAGAAGLVTISFVPDRVYTAGLLGGAVLASLLCLLALVPGRRGGGQVAVRARPVTWVLPAAGLTTAVLVGGAAGVACWIGVGVLTAVTGGSRAFAGPGHAAVVNRAVGGAGVALAGALLVVHPWGHLHYAAPTAMVQTLCLVSVAALSWSAVASARDVRPTPAVGHAARAAVPGVQQPPAAAAASPGSRRTGS